MKVTYALINQVVGESVQILKEVYPSFQYKGFTKVRISKARSKWGSVKKNCSTGDFALTISNCFEEIPDEKRARTKLLSTVTHELIHTIPGCMNHGSNFKYYAALVNRKYPALQIQRCTSMESLGIQKNTKNYPYIAKCNICNKEWKWTRKPRIFNYISACECPYCKVKSLAFTKISGITI